MLVYIFTGVNALFFSFFYFFFTSNYAYCRLEWINWIWLAVCMRAYMHKTSRIVCYCWMLRGVLQQDCLDVNQFLWLEMICWSLNIPTSISVILLWISSYLLAVLIFPGCNSTMKYSYLPSMTNFTWVCVYQWITDAQVLLEFFSHNWELKLYAN